MDNGWIKLHRKFTKWEWYDDINTKVLFIHLLITANYEDKNWRGTLIKRGQKVTSLPNLAKETCLTIRNVRTSLDRLKSTGELTDQSTNRFRLITICNYDEYQNGTAGKLADKLTGRRQASDRQTTATKEVKKERKKEFDHFWKSFPRKIGKGKAEEAFKKAVKKADYETIRVALEKQKANSQWADVKYVPHPATWLNQRRWEDEVEIDSMERRPGEDYGAWQIRIYKLQNNKP
jgi:hypothetical protein|tara:strand:+ start:651 stop:1352 length:702 start_codon:yes stop_codon:yes gene_type:complete